MSSPTAISVADDTGQAHAIARLIAVMRTLRDPQHGCEWDRAQSIASIAPYTIEEAYEVHDAIARGDMEALVDELGDLLLQVVFHSQIAADVGLFDIGHVAEAIIDKMERRHPHIFHGSTAPHDWEALKAAERGDATDSSALAGVTKALPALMVADKMQKRAARTGFDWPEAAGARDKVFEEIAEVDAAADEMARKEEIGDLLFAVVNWARHLHVDPEDALRAANAKFERRFRAMEAAAGDKFSAMPLDAKEALWRRGKAP